MPRLIATLGATLGSTLWLTVASSAGTSAADKGIVQDEHLRLAETYYFAAGYYQTTQIWIAALVDMYSNAVAKRFDKPSISVGVARLIAPDFQNLETGRRNSYVRIFARYLSSDDLRQLIAWTQTPIGRKIRLVEVPLVEDVYTDSMASVTTLYAAIYARHKADFARLAGREGTTP